MTCPPPFPLFSASHESLLTVLSDLQANHSDLLRRISTDLHEAASRLQHRAQEYDDSESRSRKEAWEAGARITTTSKAVSLSPISEENGSAKEEVEARLYAEMKSSARDVEDGNKLKLLLVRMVGCGFENRNGGFQQDSPVYDKLGWLERNSTAASLQVVYNLAACKIAEAQAHLLAQETEVSDLNTVKERKRTFSGEADCDMSDRLRAFVCERGLEPSKNRSYYGGQWRTGGEEEEEEEEEASCRISVYSRGFSDDNTAGLTEDDDSGGDETEDESATPSPSALFELSPGVIETSSASERPHFVSEESLLSCRIDMEPSQVGRRDVLRAAVRCSDILRMNERNKKLMKWAKAD